MAPSMMPLPPGLSDSSGLWDEGWHKGNKEGYNEGYQDGFHAGRVSTQPGSSNEEAQEGSSASSKQKQRKKKKSKSWVDEFNKRYHRATKSNEDMGGCLFSPVPRPTGKKNMPVRRCTPTAS